MGERVSIFQTKQKETQETIHATDRKLLISIIVLRGRIRCWFDSTKTGIFEKNIFQFRSRREEKMNRMKKKGLARLCLPSMFISGLTSYTNAYAIKMCVVISTRISKEEKQMAIFPSRSRNPSFQVKYSMSRDTWASFSTFFCYLYSGSVAFSFKTAWGQREIVSIKSRAAACYQRSSWMADITDIGKYIIMNRL